MYAKVDQYFEEVLCIFFLSVVVGSVLMQVVLRFFFHTAAAWAEETAIYGMIFAVYLGATMAVGCCAHDSRDTLLGVYRPELPIWDPAKHSPGKVATVEWLQPGCLQLGGYKLGAGQPLTCPKAKK